MAIKLYGALLEPGTERFSFSRIILGITIMFANFWVTLLVIRKGLVPDLTSVALYLGAIGTVTLGFTSARGTVETVMNKEQPK